MKKITAVIGSPKRNDSNTAKLVQAFLDEVKKIDSSIESEIITLGSLTVKPCVGCGACSRTGACVIKDDLEAIKAKLLDSEMVVLGSPVYCWHVSAQYKALIDRLWVWIHAQRLIGKPALVVSTTAIDGMKPTLKYIRDSAFMLGLIPVGELSWAVTKARDGINGKPIQASCTKIARETVRLLNVEKHVKPRIMNNFYFLGITRKAVAIPGDSWEKHFILSRGWQKMSYRKAMDTIESQDSYRTDADS
jgi:multimeric flavodoxin WrbA